MASSAHPALPDHDALLGWPVPLGESQAEILAVHPRATVLRAAQIARPMSKQPDAGGQDLGDRAFEVR
jgi:hypothetical protein